jgi:hypothetical protein
VTGVRRGLTRAGCQGHDLPHTPPTAASHGQGPAGEEAAAGPGVAAAAAAGPLSLAAGCFALGRPGGGRPWVAGLQAGLHTRSLAVTAHAAREAPPAPAGQAAAPAPPCASWGSRGLMGTGAAGGGGPGGVPSAAALPQSAASLAAVVLLGGRLSCAAWASKEEGGGCPQRRSGLRLGPLPDALTGRSWLLAVSRRAGSASASGAVGAAPG